MLAGVGFGLTHPLAQGLVVDAQIADYVGNRAAGSQRSSGRRDRAAHRGTSPVVA